MAVEVGGGDVLEALQRLRQVVFVVNRVDGALIHAGAAIDARLGIDVEHLGVGGPSAPPHGSDAVDRAYRNATRVLAAVLRDYVCHVIGPFSVGQGLSRVGGASGWSTASVDQRCGTPSRMRLTAVWTRSAARGKDMLPAAA